MNRYLETKHNRQQLATAVGIILVLFISLGLRLVYFDKHTFDYDEGTNLMFAMLESDGFAPYTEIFVGIPPLALLTIQWGAILFGSSLWVRLPMMLFSLVGVAAMYVLVKRQAGSLAGLLAASFLSFNMAYFVGSTTIMAEVPAVAMAVLSVALADFYHRQCSYLWLVLSGLAFAASLSLKVFLVFLPLLIALQLLAKEKGIGSTSSLSKDRNLWKNIVKDGLIWLTGVIILTAVFSALYEPNAMYEQVIQFRLLIRAAELDEGLGVIHNLIILIQEIFINYLYLILLTAAGIIFIRWRIFKIHWLWMVWLGLSLFVLFTHIPLRPRYSVMTLPGWAALGGIGTAEIINFGSSRLSIKNLRIFVPLVTTMIIILAIIPPARLLDTPPVTRFAELNQAHHAAASFIAEFTASDDCIITDDQRFAFLSNRLVPPDLSETSRARLLVNWLSVEDVVTSAQKYGCSSLVYTNDRFDTYLPDLSEKASELFSIKMVFAQPDSKWQATAFIVPTNILQTASIPIARHLGDNIELKGVDLIPTVAAAGDHLEFSSYWQTHQNLKKNYKIFLHLKDQQGTVFAAYDHYPFNLTPHEYLTYNLPQTSYQAKLTEAELAHYPAAGMLPTRLWLPNHVLKETIRPKIPETLPPGNYSLSLGMYDEQTGERLTVSDNDLNEIIIGQVEVLP